MGAHMERIYSRGYCERAKVAADQPGTPIRFVASTTGVKRDGLSLDMTGADLANFRKNPAFLWSHDYMGQRPPIGRVEHMAVENGALMADVIFDQGDEFAREVERKYRSGFLSAVSIGFDIHEMQPPADGKPPTATKWEVIDLSGVNVPGDPSALMERQKRAYADLGRALLDAAGEPVADPADASHSTTPLESSHEPGDDASPSARATWEQTSRQMADLFAPFAQRPDAEREAEYRRHAREYARHKRTPPEFVPQADLDAMGAEAIRALFLAGEPELHAEVFAAMEYRAGAVLNTRNRERLQQAAALIGEVLKTADKMPKDDDMPMDDDDDEKRMAGVLATIAAQMAGVGA